MEDNGDLVLRVFCWSELKFENDGVDDCVGVEVVVDVIDVVVGSLLLYLVISVILFVVLKCFCKYKVLLIKVWGLCGGGGVGYFRSSWSVIEYLVLRIDIGYG